MSADEPPRVFELRAPKEARCNVDIHVKQGDHTQSIPGLRCMPFPRGQGAGFPEGAVGE